MLEQLFDLDAILFFGLVKCDEALCLHWHSRFFVLGKRKATCLGLAAAALTSQVRRAVIDGNEVRESSHAVAALKVAFLLVHNLHFDLQVLHKHADRILIRVTKRNNYIGVFHGRLDEVVVCWLNEAVVLHEYVDDGATAIGDVSLNYKEG